MRRRVDLIEERRAVLRATLARFGTVEAPLTQMQPQRGTAALRSR
jgi:hypothetical protein